MKSETITVLQLFQDRRQYRVPFYQRAYVWNREEQWEPLWEDIEEKAEARIADAQPTPHFLGATVLEPQQRRGLLGVELLHIIDGQQRLTTLQYVLAALAIFLRESGSAALLSRVEGCLRNANTETMLQADVEMFKVWPTFRDRQSYKTAMLAVNQSELRDTFPQSFTQSGGLRKIGVDHPPALEAIWYFNDKISSWVAQGGSPTLVPLDEAWAYLKHPLFRERLREWLKTMRKNNGVVVLATQNLSDIVNSPIGDVILETCPTKVLLPNAEAANPASREFYERLGLNDRELSTVQTSVPKRDYYVISPLGRRLIGLGLGEVALSFVGMNSREDRDAAELLMINHQEGWQAEWLRRRGVPDWADYYSNLNSKLGRKHA